MPEVSPPATVSLEASLRAAASLFEREESEPLPPDPDDPDTHESQQDTAAAQPEQSDDEAVESEEGSEPAEAQDDEEDHDESEEPRKPRLIKVGEEELPEDEVAKGYLRTADYTRKTQQLAEARKGFEGEQESVRTERQQLAQQITQLAEALKRQTPQEPEWDTLRRENPDEFAATWAAWDQHTKTIARIEAAQKEAVAKVTKDQIDRYNQHVESERAKLVEAIPAWKEEAVATKERKALFDFAKSAGYTESELDAVADHRVMVLLRKAYLYDQGQQKKPAVQQTIAKVKAATPGPAEVARKKPMPESVKAKLRLARSGSVKDAARLFELMDD